jgi:hypothetical protein
MAWTPVVKDGYIHPEETALATAPVLKRCGRQPDHLSPSMFLEVCAMPTVQIANDTKYGKAIALLYDLGGIFRTKPTRQLVIGPTQLQALQTAGLVPKTKGARKRGRKNP